MWSIVKDNIGKDLSQITMPVIFNNPEGLLQKGAATLEYASPVIDQACQGETQAQRIAIMAIFGTTLITPTERNANKPFNPLLGETYELCNDNFDFIAE